MILRGRAILLNEMTRIACDRSRRLGVYCGWATVEAHDFCDLAVRAWVYELRTKSVDTATPISPVSTFLHCKGEGVDPGKTPTVIPEGICAER